ncbi:MAG: amidase family protein, partial [Pseudomonadota bacterium]
IDREATLAAAAKATGPLKGVGLAIKDNIDTEDFPTSGGTPGLKGRRSGDAAVMAKLRAAGGVPLGKTNLHELAFGITSNNAGFGAVRNPWNTDLIPGGSSGGTAAAVAAGLAPAGLGTDTGGSCRIPAALCGVVGFRPTLHRWAQGGIVPITHLRDTAGPLARSVADCRLLDDLCAAKRAERPEPSLRGKRLGIPRAYFWDGLEEGVASAMQQALNVMTGAGAEIVETDVPDVAALEDTIGFPSALFEAPRELAMYLALSGDRRSVLEVVEQIAGAGEKGVLASTVAGESAMPAAAYQHALGVARPALRAAFAQALDGLHALVVPCTPLTARPIGDDEMVSLNGEKLPTMGAYIRNTDPTANAGLPGLTVPGGLAEGELGALPFGVEFIGAEGSDGQLLALGEAYEAARGPMPAPPL